MNISWAGAIDLFFPLAEKLSAEDREKEEASDRVARDALEFLSSDIAELRECLTSISSAVELEHARKTGVDARLMSVTTIISVAATIIFTAIFGLLAGTIPIACAGFKVALILGCFYLALQSIAAFHAAVVGLKRAGYMQENWPDLLPRKGNDASNLLRTRIKTSLEMLQDHRKINNGKVTQMAVAHRALQNFLWALLLIAGIAGFAAIFCPPRPPSMCGTASAGPCPPTRQDPDPIGSVPSLIIGQVRVGTVGPFKSGQHVLDSAVAACVETESANLVKSRPVAWQLIGRVDRQELTRRTAKVYGSNQTLGMARAAWVRDHMFGSSDTLRASDVSIFAGGAENIGFQVAAEKLRSDRVVEIFAFIPLQTSSSGNTHPPIEFSCPPASDVDHRE